jgi:hypothetical protein
LAQSNANPEACAPLETNAHRRNANGAGNPFPRPLGARGALARRSVVLFLLAFHRCAKREQEHRAYEERGVAGLAQEIRANALCGKRPQFEAHCYKAGCEENVAPNSCRHAILEKAHLNQKPNWLLFAGF